MIVLKSKCMKISAILLAILFLFSLSLAVTAKEAVISESEQEALPCRSAILMDAATGAVLLEQNADEALPPASVTKIMTLLLVMEALESGRIAWTDMVTASANAASMGGSQVYLKEGESMSVEDMLKSVVIASANDCAVALAEFVSGSESAFVDAMNARAAELGMKNTHFENTNGLDDTVENHVTSARDIAIMSRALISHPKILEYSSTWMDTIREGAFGLTNTNRLVRFYRGCTGLKTGSTSRAGFCVSTTAERDGVSLICVIMAAQTRDIRNATAAKLLDFGFANYATFRGEAGTRQVSVFGGVAPSLQATWEPIAITVPKGSVGRVALSLELPEALSAPVQAGAEIGAAVYTLDGKEIGRVPVIAANEVAQIGFGELFSRMLAKFFLL